MLRLESKILQREFKVHEGNLYASQIRNTLSGKDFIPDGNSVEFLFHFTDGSEFTSKGLHVTNQSTDNHKLSFTFEECEGIVVTMTLWVGDDSNTLKKQISFVQKDTRTIDYILLEHIGIINSETNYFVPENVESQEASPFHLALGQPFYIDSLFFGCELPATRNTIEYGKGIVKYYLGKNVEGVFHCPVTIVGGAKSNLMIDVQKAFFEYIDHISKVNDIRIQYNTWYDQMLNIDNESVINQFYEIEKHLSANGVAPLDAYVVDDGWNDYKAAFWSFNKKFPNKLSEISSLTNRLSSELGLWLGPRGGYTLHTSFAKRMERKGFGGYNASSKDICVAHQDYQQKLSEFILNTTKEYNIKYWKFDGFSLAPCGNPNHPHLTGGEYDMYEITEMWEGFIEIFKKLDKSIWINMTCYVNPSPWWLQYANNIWLQNSKDVGFSENHNEQSKIDSEITYRDTKYFELLCQRAAQIPTKYLYNHEPIYGNTLKLEYTDDEFEKYLYFNACRGQALNELHLSANKMNKSKWRTLANVINWQRSNYDILKNAMLLGGKPDENNIYGYFSWNDKGDGVIALRNPNNEKTALTLTLNKLMGCPEGLKNVKRYNVYSQGAKESYKSYNYGDKINLTLKPFEIRIIQFGNEDRRYDYLEGVNEFTISFNHNDMQENCNIAQNDDISIRVVDGILTAKIDTCVIKSNDKINNGNNKIIIVREKNKLIKLYINKKLIGSIYDKNAKGEIDCNIVSLIPNNEFNVEKKSTPYNEIFNINEIFAKRKKKLL